MGGAQGGYLGVGSESQPQPGPQMGELSFPSPPPQITQQCGPSSEPFTPGGRPRERKVLGQEDKKVWGSWKLAKTERGTPRRDLGKSETVPLWRNPWHQV